MTTGGYAKLGVSGRMDFADPAVVDICQRRCLVGQILAELSDGIGRAFDLDHDAGSVVAYEAGQMQARGETVHERPETNPLDDAVDFYQQPLPIGRPGLA